METSTFHFNIAFTLPVNPPRSSSDRLTLTARELWQGIKRGGRNPNDFAEYVASCEILSGGRKKFVRRLTLADGAVHTAKGQHLDQDVEIADDLLVLATTINTGAKSTWLLSHDASDEANESNLYLTAMYELKLTDVEPGTQKAEEIKANYTTLAKGACRSGVEKIRQWKMEGKLEEWQREDEALDREASEGDELWGMHAHDTDHNPL